MGTLVKLFAMVALARRHGLFWRIVAAIVLAGAAASAETIAAVVSGQLAQDPTVKAVRLLAVMLLSQTLFDTSALLLLSSAAGRAERLVRAKLIRATFSQPIRDLEEQEVGNLLERVDNDPAAVASVVRRAGWLTCTSSLRLLSAWMVAGWLWWPAWILFPVIGAVIIVMSKRTTQVVAARRLAEQEEWSRHAAVVQEAVAAGDDLRSARGQAFVVRRYTEQARQVLNRVGATSTSAALVIARPGLLVYATLGLVVIFGVGLVSAKIGNIAQLVTIWLLVGGFAGQTSLLMNQVPRLQSALGAATRIRQLLNAASEPAGGESAPTGTCDLELRELSVSYPGGFAVRNVNIVIPAGTSCALVGHSGGGKTTIAKVVTRWIDPPASTVFLGHRDVTTINLQELRQVVGVVTQQTEILAASLADNLSLFADIPRTKINLALDELGLRPWVNSLQEGLDTLIGPGGKALSGGEEQLVAFVRLLLRDVSLVILDEATARMDPVTEELVTKAAQRLLSGRTSLVISHNLTSIRNCDSVAVMDGGFLVQHGPWAEIAERPGPFRNLWGADGFAMNGETGPLLTEVTPVPLAATSKPHPTLNHTVEPRMQVGYRDSAQELHFPHRTLKPSLSANVFRALRSHRRWGPGTDLLWFIGFLTSAHGLATGWLWGRLVQSLRDGGTPWGISVLLISGLLLSPLLMALAVKSNPLWAAAITLRLRLSMLRGQTAQRRVVRVPAGVATARALDSDRFVTYAHRWVDVFFATVSVALTAVVSTNLLAAAMTGGVLLGCAVLALFGSVPTKAAAKLAGDRRAHFGGLLSTTLQSSRTVKLTGATSPVENRLARNDAARVFASTREERWRILLEAGPNVLMWTAVLLTWWLYLQGVWPLSTALLVATTVRGFRWFGSTLAAVITEAPAARTWLLAAAVVAGTDDLVTRPPGVDFAKGTAPSPKPTGRVPLRSLELKRFTAVHEDGTVGVSYINLSIAPGSLVQVIGRVGSGKSSLLAALAGILDYKGHILWNGYEVKDPQLFLVPSQVAYVAPIPKVLRGTIADNVSLDYDYDVAEALNAAHLSADAMIGRSMESSVGPGGARLSGGQLQRLALARALATKSELLVADDITSALDPRTEKQVWATLRRRETTVVAATTRRASLEFADLVVVLQDGQIVARGCWADLQSTWGGLVT